jgi:hypothetical protein
MSDIRLLMLVDSYPHRRALAHRAGTRSLFPHLRYLEQHGFVKRRQDRYLLTRRGRDELSIATAIAHMLMRRLGQVTADGAAARGHAGL